MQVSGKAVKTFKSHKDDLKSQIARYRKWIGIWRQKYIDMLSPYIITWFTLIPTKGIVLLKDQKRIDAMNARKGAKEISVYSGNKQKAIAKIEKLKGRLSKEYLVFIYTDKQFGMRKYGQSLESILTEFQKKSSLVIK